MYVYAVVQHGDKLRGLISVSSMERQIDIYVKGRILKVPFSKARWGLHLSRSLSPMNGLIESTFTKDSPTMHQQRLRSSQLDLAYFTQTVLIRKEERAGWKTQRNTIHSDSDGEHNAA